MTMRNNVCTTKQQVLYMFMTMASVYSDTRTAMMSRYFYLMTYFGRAMRNAIRVNEHFI